MTEAANPVIALWKRHGPSGGYPAGVISVTDPIAGRAFFPGGFGLWGAEAGRPLPRFPVRGVMVLGHDFHSESGYRASLERGEESGTQPTWRNLVSVLKRAGIPLDHCFFTNYYMGLRQGSGTTGRFPGANNLGFVEHCRTFLLDQLQTQKPQLLITLGINVPSGIAPLSDELRDWGTRRGLKYLDQVGALRRNVHFKGLDDFATTVVALTHPSLRHASVRHRRYRGVAGDEAEILLLTDAVAGLDILGKIF